MKNYYDNYVNRKKFVTHLVKFDKDQLFEISTGSLMGLTVDQITLYARPEWSYLIMRLIKETLIEQMDIEKIKYMADTRFNYPQMILIKTAFNNGFSINEVRSFTNEEYTYSQMHDAYTKLLEKKQAME